MADKVEFKGDSQNYWSRYSWQMERQQARDRNTIVNLQNEVSRLKQFEKKHIDIDDKVDQFMQKTVASLDTYLGNLQTTKQQKELLSSLSSQQSQTILDQHVLLSQYKEEVEMYKTLLEQAKEQMTEAIKEQDKMKAQLAEKDIIIAKYSAYMSEKRDLLDFYDEE